jgi:hypothetical protein
MEKKIIEADLIHFFLIYMTTNIRYFKLEK